MYLDKFKLTGKIAVATGAARGIGYAAVEALAEAGAKVVLTDMNDALLKDATATLKLGQARGIAMLVPARAGLVVAEYAPNAVKKAVIGVGHGDKKQIHMMVKVLLPKATFDTEHAADALAIAICHAHHRQSVTYRMAIAG